MWETTRRRSSLGMVIISLCAHAYAALEFLLINASRSSPWSDQICWILGFSLILSLLLPLLPNRYVIVVMLVVRYYVFLRMGYPFEDDLGISRTIWNIMLIEAAWYLPLGISLAVNSFFVSCTIFVQLPDLHLLLGESRDVSFSLARSVGFVILSSALRRLMIELASARRTIFRLNDVIRQLGEASLGLQDQLISTEHNTRSSERERITGEIHDIMGYALTNIMMIMEASIVKADPDSPLLGNLREARDQARNGLIEIRKALGLARSIDTARRGLYTIIHLVRAFQEATGIEVDTDFANSPTSFGEEIDHMLSRFVQEGLINAFHHGHASKVRIHFLVDDNHLQARILDNGSGSSVIIENIGLRGMRERIEKLGGTLVVTSLPHGFELNTRIPLPTHSGN